MEKIKLTGGPAKTVTWIWLDPEWGAWLKVEYYDFSELAQRMFGNDIAYTITVNKMNKLLLTAKQDEKSIATWMAENFKSYFEIKHWLEENEIDFHIDAESWA